MDRTELTIVAATALMVALGLGWVLRWIYSMLNPPPPPAPKADSEWAEYARACEAQRDEAQARLAEVEREWSTKLTQAHAELSAAMEGLGAARRATRELEARMADMETAKSVPYVEAPAAPAGSGADETPSDGEPTAPDGAAAEPEQAIDTPPPASDRSTSSGKGKQTDR